MKFKVFFAVLAMFVSLGLSAQDLTSDKGKLSYAIGYKFGTDFRSGVIDVDIDTLVQAVRDGAGGTEPSVPEEEMVALMQALQERIKTEQLEKFKLLAEENKVKSDNFLSENKAKRGIVVLPSGVQYRVIEEGSGSRPMTESEVSVHYRSSTMNGLEFDSSFARGEPVIFKVDQVIKGWQEVLPLMKTGAKWQVFVPPELAYGLRGQRPVGPNEALVFDINLVEIKS
jgi:FKBP-type peptidyl-prolyl cis-trans isomerase FklB